MNSIDDSKFIAMQCWGKTNPYKSLYQHMLDTAACCSALLKCKEFKFQEESFCRISSMEIDKAERWIPYIAALHDIGKCTPGFQVRAIKIPQVQNWLRKIKDIEWYMGVDSFHSYDSYEYIYKELNNVDKETVGLVLNLHHGICGGNAQHITGTIWEKAQNYLDEMLKSVLNIRDERIYFSDCSSAGIYLSGIIVLSDWIASNNELYKLIQYETDDPFEYYAFAYNEAEKAVKRIGFGLSNMHSNSFKGHKLWNSMGICNTRPLQKLCEDICSTGLEPGILIIEAPMGEGKTEAALYVSEYWQGMYGYSGSYFALPTQATSNQMYERIKEFLNALDKHINPLLVHGGAWLLDDHTVVNETQSADEYNDRNYSISPWFLPRKRSLLSRWGVGTIDQAMLSVLNVRHGFLRLFGLSGKVLIIDEAHAYDSYMYGIISRLLLWCRHLKIPVIILSATLPYTLKKTMLSSCGFIMDNTETENIQYPSVTHCSYNSGKVDKKTFQASQRKQVKIHIEYGALNNPEKLSILAAKTAQNGGKICILVNTVDTAQKVMRNLVNWAKDKKISSKLLCFHRRMRSLERQKIEDEVLKIFGKNADDEDAILIATQIVEQSLDIDFDVLITELAPIDLLFQRIGRLHRHKRSCRKTVEAVVYIAFPERNRPNDFGITGKVYSDIYYLKKTAGILIDRQFLNLPKDIPVLVERVYSPPVESDDYELKRNWEEVLDNQSIHHDASYHYLINMPNNKSFRWDSPIHKVFEEDNDKDYLNVKTRLSDEKLPVLVLIGSEKELFEKYKLNQKNKVLLKELFLRVVDVTKWWGKDLESLEEIHIIGHNIKVLLIHDQSINIRGVVFSYENEYGIERREN